MNSSCSKTKFQKVMGLYMVFMFLIGVLLAYQPVAAAPKVTWKFNLSEPRIGFYWSSTMAASMAERIKTRTNGNFNLDIYLGGQLGINPQDYIRTTGQGATEISQIYLGYAYGDVPIWGVSEIPFLGVNPQTKRKAMHETLRPLYERELERFNCKLLVSVPYGLVNVMTTRPVPDLMNWKGIKLRVPGKWIGAAVRAMGGTDVFIPPAELYPAVQRKIVDGTVTSTTAVVGTPLKELIKYVYLSHISAGPWFIFVNKSALAALPDEYRTVLLEEAKRTEAEGWARIYPYDKGEKEDIVILKKLGVEVAEIPDEIMSQTITKCKHIGDMWAAEVGGEASTWLNMVRAAVRE